jgi:hypothetical protein
VEYSGFEFLTSGFDTFLNHNLSKKLKLIRLCEFNHLIYTLITDICTLQFLALYVITMRDGCYLILKLFLFFTLDFFFSS